MARKYGTILITQMGLLIIDLFFNTFTMLFSVNVTLRLMLYILQDTLLVLSIVVMVISFSSTFVFQAGLISILLTKFASTIIISFIYLVLSVALHFFSLHQAWFNLERRVWTNILFTLYVVQRTVAIFYYFTYKRTVLLLSNPKYHTDSEWIREQVRQRS